MALTRGGPTAVTPPPPQRTPASPPGPAPIPPLSRNPFAFARVVAPLAATVPETPRFAPVEAAATAAPSPVRLVGFVHQGDRLKAALVLEGETVLMSVGDTASGYRLLAADEDEGVRLADPDGRERLLALPE